MTNRKENDQEMSMEEILASIRKYVTDDDRPKYQTSTISDIEEEPLDLRLVSPPKKRQRGQSQQRIHRPHLRHKSIQNLLKRIRYPHPQTLKNQHNSPSTVSMD